MKKSNTESLGIIKMTTLYKCQQEIDCKFLGPRIQWCVRKKMVYYTLIREGYKQCSGDQNEERKLKKQLSTHV